MKKKNVAVIVGSLAAAVALVVGPTMAASADASASYWNGGIQRASGYWNASLDQMSAYDAYSDGWGARTRWETVAGGSGKVETIAGAGTTAYQHIGGVGTIRLKSCSINNGNDVGCSAFSAYSGG